MHAIVAYIAKAKVCVDDNRGCFFCCQNRLSPKLIFRESSSGPYVLQFVVVIDSTVAARPTVETIFLRSGTD
jgi:hypothetical protein